MPDAAYMEYVDADDSGAVAGGIETTGGRATVAGMGAMGATATGGIEIGVATGTSAVGAGTGITGTTGTTVTAGAWTGARAGARASAFGTIALAMGPAAGAWAR